MVTREAVSPLDKWGRLGANLAIVVWGAHAIAGLLACNLPRVGLNLLIVALCVLGRDMFRPKEGRWS